MPSIKSSGPSNLVLLREIKAVMQEVSQNTNSGNEWLEKLLEAIKEITD